MIYLPRLEDHEVADAEDTSSQAAAIREGAGQCVLLVDDESFLLETNRSALESIGYQVLEAGDGLQAIERLLLPG